MKYNNFEKTFKISQYADDSIIILKDVQYITPALKVLQTFGQLAGLQLNTDKTKIMLLGPLKQSATSLKSFECVENIKSLGIVIGHDKTHCIKKNRTEKIDKIKIMIQRW